MRNSIGPWWLCGLVGLVGCGGQVELIALTGAGGASGTAGTTGGAASTGGAWATGGSLSTGGVPSIIQSCPGISIATTSLDAGTSDASIASQLCAGVGIETEPIPVDLFIMLDRTQSMTDTIQNSSLQRWDVIVQGLQKFTSFTITRVGLDYVGKTDSPSDPGECDATTYAEPAVPIDYLRNNATTLVQSVTDERALLGGQAPWFAALQGGLQFAQKWQTASPAHQTVFVFVTDGNPGECDVDMNHVSALVGDARQARGLFAGGPSIYTYVIGIAVDRSNLDAIAQAGGTLQATIVDGPTAPDQFAAALQNAVISIGTPHMNCEFSIPTPPAEQRLDLGKIQVILRPYNGGEQEIPLTASAADCGRPNGGWYFDNATSPLKINLCPCTCANLSAASAEVRFGCRTGSVIN